jgi:hypothetical protein
MSALSTTARHEYYAELGNSLPPPVIASPEIRHRRLTTAVEAFEALRPGDAYEARLAVQVVLCGAHAAESLREAGVHRENFAKSSRCRAQAASMMREERAAKRMLAQEQKVRLATEAVTNTPVAGAPKAQPTTVSAQLRQAEPHTAAPPAQAAVAAPQLAPASAPVPPAMQAPPPSPEAIAKAEAYAQKNSVAAAQIRHDRGVTPQNKAYFRHLTLPTDPALIDALVRGTTLTLTLLDDVGGETLDAAA